MKLYDLLKDLGFNRYPIRVHLSATVGEVPEIELEIVNHTPAYSVHINQVRIHFGVKSLTRAFILEPISTVTLPPKGRNKWTLPYEETRIIERRIQKSPPGIFEPNQQPPIKSPAQLFNAIGMGAEKASWIEIDFNEYEQRVFLRGKVKGMFDLVGNQHKQIRERDQKENAEPPVFTELAKPKKATLLLPSGSKIELDDFKLTLGELIGIAHETLEDARFTPENFGVSADFFFVNTSTGSLIDSLLDLSRPISTLFINDSDVVELRLCQPDPQPDGAILNPMRGVTNFIR